ncbi:hypothetical protein N8J89_04330 [Crossiella sp. CA-258035]|uniref:hypothetical protein n=1 Tax=Crossiella sp. CA-258035 TaxID=2981138 RepID=UPI0024BCE21D|nr:hypothetical protein [Crossiella sp. CA-258035]WHT20305.1 hypothetical protein N8J89_04330 [Crossiella sp. CA-258035]
MRAVRVVGLVATAVALTAGMAVSPASAQAEERISNTNYVEPGGVAELQGSCSNPEKGASVSSPAFAAPAKMSPRPPSAHLMTGKAQVREDALPGSYELVLTCDKERFRGTMRVYGYAKPALVLSPPSGSPGATVKLLALCTIENKMSNPTSAALDGKITWKRIGPSRYEAVAKVADVAPGKYPVEYNCHTTVKVSAVFTVRPKGKPAPPPPAPGQGQVKDKPKGGAETGGGMS